MFGKNKDIKQNEFEEESDINPEDILEDEISSIVEEPKIKEDPLDIEKKIKLEENSKEEESLKVEIPEIKEEQGMEEQMVNLVHQQTQTIMEHEQMIRLLMQNYENMNERIKSLESSLFRIRSS